jgi:hypothetical protein
LDNGIGAGPRAVQECFGMKNAIAAIGALAVLGAPAAAGAQARGGFHHGGGGAHAGGFHGGMRSGFPSGAARAGGLAGRSGGWRGFGGYRPFRHGFFGPRFYHAPRYSFALGFGFGYPWYGYPWYGSPYYGWPGVTVVESYRGGPAVDPWSVDYGVSTPSGAAPAQACGQWVWDGAKYNWAPQPCAAPAPAAPAAAAPGPAGG